MALHAAGYAPPLRRHPMADVSDGQCRADARSGSPFLPLRTRADPVRRRSLHAFVTRMRLTASTASSISASARCPRGALSGWRVFNRQYGDLSVAADPSLAASEFGRFSPFEALVRWYRGAAGGPARAGRYEARVRACAACSPDKESWEILFGKRQFERH
jgi:hypothetical protein